MGISTRPVRSNIGDIVDRDSLQYLCTRFELKAAGSVAESTVESRVLQATDCRMVGRVMITHIVPRILVDVAKKLLSIKCNQIEKLLSKSFPLYSLQHLMPMDSGRI